MSNNVRAEYLAAGFADPTKITVIQPGTPQTAPTQLCSGIVTGRVIVWTITSEREKESLEIALKASLVRDCLPWLVWEGHELFAINMPTEKFAHLYFWMSGFGDGRFSADPTNR